MKGNADSSRMLVRAPNWLGDSVMALPAVAALRTARPDAYVTVLARTPFDELWRMTVVDAVIPFSVRAGLRGLADRRRLAAQIRDRHFGAALILPNSFDSALVPWLAGIPTRIGRPRDGRGVLLTDPVPFPRHMRGRHLSRWYAYLVQYWLGEPLSVDYNVRVAPPDQVYRSVQEQRDTLRPRLVGLNPGATYGTAKRWPAERYAELGVKAVQELNASVVICGGPADADVCRAVENAMLRRDSTTLRHCINTVGSSIAASAAWLDYCHCLVTNDTGGMHLSAAVGTPVVAIFGPTKPAETAPLGQGHRLIVADVPCGPCMQRECRMPTHECMESISVGRVWQEVVAAIHSQM